MRVGYVLITRSTSLEIRSRSAYYISTATYRLQHLPQPPLHHAAVHAVERQARACGGVYGLPTALGVLELAHEEVHLSADDALLLTAAVDEHLGISRCTALVKQDNGARAPGARRAAGAVEQLERVVVRLVHRRGAAAACVWEKDVAHLRPKVEAARQERRRDQHARRVRFALEARVRTVEEPREVLVGACVARVRVAGQGYVAGLA